MHDVKQRFSITERLLLLPILSGSAPGCSITAVRILDDLQRELGFTEAEAAAVNLRTEGDNTLWDLAADPNKEIEVGPIGMRLIVSSLRLASSREALHTVHIPLWDRFVTPVEEDEKRRAEAAAAASGN